jgi:hypothetical protein
MQSKNLKCTKITLVYAEKPPLYLNHDMDWNYTTSQTLLYDILDTISGLKTVG